MTDDAAQAGARPADRGSGSGVRIDHVGYTYRTSTGLGVEAIGDVDLDVRAGEFVCILGLSGCGKSTLLKLVAGLELPTRGTISVNGSEVRGPGHERGMVFQDYAVLPWLTVRGNIELGPKLQGKWRSERRAIAEHFIGLVGLEGFEGNYPFALSGGMRQRVAVARTLAAAPSVILMDEPFGALDAQTRHKLQKDLVEIWHKTGKTILFVTHSVSEAAYLSDRVVVLSARPSHVEEIVEIDTPRDQREEETMSAAHADKVRYLSRLLHAEEGHQAGGAAG